LAILKIKVQLAQWYKNYVLYGKRKPFESIFQQKKDPMHLEFCEGSYDQNS